MMKTNFALMLLLSSLFMSGTVAQDNTFRITGRVKDLNGKGIAGVVVYDSQNFTRTDGDGYWELRTDTAYSKFISISTPADYQLPQKEGLAAGFYVPVGKAVREKGHDFLLERRGQAVEDFYYLAVSDPQIRDEEDFQRWTDETVEDLRRVTDSLRKEREVVGMTLGDLVFDNMGLYQAYADSWKNMGLTSFQCIGNHDFDRRYQALNNMRQGSAAYGEQVYGRYFGPTDYSFNIGKVHVITMNNINYLGGYRYVECLTDRQIAWLEKDLSYVAKGTTVILNMHAAGWNKVSNVDNMRNPDRLLDVLKDYRVHMFCGHTHYFQNVEVNERFYQHNIGAACGAWWSGWINRCGAPNGYMIVDVRGDSLRWQFKPTGLPLDVQLKLYARGEFGSQPGYVVANVWDYDSECRVEWFQDGKLMGEMERFTDEDYGYRSRYAKGTSGTLTTHLFRCQPVGEYQELRVVFTNRFGKSFSQVLTSRAEVIAHRGGAGLYPENTIEAMYNALRLGVRNLEMDMQVTKDSIVVVSHDSYLKGYGERYPIFGYRYEELAKLPIGHKKDKQYPGRVNIPCHLPKVTELIDSVEAYCHRHHLPPVDYTIEVKSDPSYDGTLSPDYKTFTDLCVQALQSKNLGNRLLLQSFDLRTLRYVHERYPHIHQLYLIDEAAGSYEEAMRTLGFTPYAIGPDSKMVNGDFVRKAHAAGMRVLPWTVNTEAETRRLTSAGVDGIITNYPDKMRDWVR